jgi:hypothetical protein
MPHSQVSSSASDLLTDSTRASSVNAFHRPLRLSSPALNFAERNSDLSPAVEGFSFTEPEPKAHPQVPPVTGLAFDVDFDEKPHALQLAAPPDTKTPSMAQPVARSASSRRRTQYYEETPAYKEGQSQSTKERIQRDSPVIAELRTNVIVSCPVFPT